MYDSAPDDMWFPSISELLDAGVIHGLVKSDLTPYNSDIPRFGVTIEVGDNLHVFKVYEHSVADKMQLQKGDVLLQWNDVKLDSYDDFLDQLEKLNLGDRFHVKIRRGDSVLELEGVLQ